MKSGWIRAVFAIAGIFDILVALAFLAAGDALFDSFGVTRPNHPGYIQFPALLLIIFGILMLRISRDPVRFRELMWYGMGLKAAYSGVVFYYQFTAGIPFMWIPFAIADVIFLVLFLIAWKSVGMPKSV